MKIIQRGNTNIRTYEFKCEGCDSLLSITAKDLRLSSQYEKKDGSPVLWCKCRVCKRISYFDAAAILKKLK